MFQQTAKWELLMDIDVIDTLELVLNDRMPIQRTSKVAYPSRRRVSWTSFVAARFLETLQSRELQFKQMLIAGRG